MVKQAGRILVIDDDEVVLEAIRDLLEDAGYSVFTQTSPIGATQLVQRENIEGALIDLNLPELQGDNVIRLFRSWDRLRDMPLVIVSSAPKDKLNAVAAKLGVDVVRKDEMHLSLVPTLTRALQKVRTTPRARSQDATPMRGSDEPADSISSRFGDELARGTLLAEDVWNSVTSGRLERVQQLGDTLALLQGQAQLLGNLKLSELLAALREVLLAVRSTTVITPSQSLAVRDSLAALRGLRRSRESTFQVSPEPLIAGLRAVRRELEALGPKRMAPS